MLSVLSSQFQTVSTRARTMRNRVFREPGGTPRDFTANPPPQCETACFRRPLLFLFLKEQIKDIDRVNERHQSESQRFAF
jgi:hypothetical protein